MSSALRQPGAETFFVDSYSTVAGIRVAAVLIRRYSDTHRDFIRFMTSFVATMGHFQFMNELAEPVTNTALP